MQLLKCGCVSAAVYTKGNFVNDTLWLFHSSPFPLLHNPIQHDSLLTECVYIYYLWTNNLHFIRFMNKRLNVAAEIENGMWAPYKCASVALCTSNRQLSCAVFTGWPIADQSDLMWITLLQCIFISSFSSFHISLFPLFPRCWKFQDKSRWDTEWKSYWG